MACLGYNKKLKYGIKFIKIDLTTFVGKSYYLLNNYTDLLV